MKIPYKYIAGISIAVLVFAFLIYISNTEERQIEKKDHIKEKIIEQVDFETKTLLEQNQIDKDLIARLENNIDARNNDIKRNKACISINSMLKGTLKEPILCDNVPVLLAPDELFYSIKASDNPYVTQNEHDHFKKVNGGMLATDVATGFKAEVYAPDYLGEVKIYELEVLEDNLLGNYVKLKWKEDGDEMFWIIGHIRTKFKTGDTVYTGQRIGEMNMSGATTGYHSHIELWRDGLNISYTTRSKVLANKRAGVYENDGEAAPIYFSHYDLGDPNQNDASPCIGASTKDLCKLAETGVQSIALTMDIRKLYGINFGDTISVVHKDTGTMYKVQVEDEMNIRFRTTCIKKQGACIKGDIAHYKGKANNSMPSGVYTIIK